MDVTPTQSGMTASDDEARRRRRARLRIYEALGVAVFMLVLLFALWWYVQSRLP